MRFMSMIVATQYNGILANSAERGKAIRILFNIKLIKLKLRKLLSYISSFACKALIE